MNTTLTVRSSVLLLGLSAATVPLCGQDPTIVERLLAVRSAADQSRCAAEQATLQAAQIQCGTWHAIGPLKDAVYGVFGREFATVFDPERDVIARGPALAELDKSYQSVPVAGALDGTRRWAAHPEWVDGYYNAVPSGPPPGRNEVTYLYRTITCAVAVDVATYLVTLDAAKVWLDGQPILVAPIREGAGQRFLQASFKLPLRAGENRLLVKIVKCFQTNGFSFAMDGLHPIHPLLRGQSPVCDAGRFDGAFEPYASASWQRSLGRPDVGSTGIRQADHLAGDVAGVSASRGEPQHNVAATCLSRAPSCVNKTARNTSASTCRGSSNWHSFVRSAATTTVTTTPSGPIRSLSRRAVRRPG